MTPTRRRRLAVSLAVAIVLLGVPTATAEVRPSTTTNAPTATSTMPAPAQAGGAVGAAAAVIDQTTPAAVDDEAGGVQGSSANWLVKNGLISPLCQMGRTLLGAPMPLAGVLDPAQEAAEVNCSRSGSASVPAGVDGFAYDIHIDTGFGGFSSRSVAKWLQMLTSTAWMLMIYFTSALFVFLEFAFGLDFVGDPALMGQLQPQLEALQAQVTRPLLAGLSCVLAVWLAVTVSQRRSREAIAGAIETFCALVMVFFVLSNPLGTIGFVAQQVDRIALGLVSTISLAPGAATSPQASQQTYVSGLQSAVAVTLSGPFSLMEFGDARWGTDPRELSPRLKQAALRLAEDDAQRDAIARATTNAELFLAFPANGPARNSINQNDPPSLLRVMCASDDDDHCRGELKDQARARTESSTFPRIATAAMLIVGLAPTWVLLAFIVAELLGASVMTLIRVLQLAFTAPVVYFGRAGRARMRDYGRNLLGALFAKLLYAVLLTLALDVFRVLSLLDAIGFWMQFLLIAIAMGMILRHRHSLWGIARMQHRDWGERVILASQSGGRRLARNATRLASPAPSPRPRPARTPAAAAGVRARPPRGAARADGRRAISVGSRRRVGVAGASRAPATAGSAARAGAARASVATAPLAALAIGQIAGRLRRGRHRGTDTTKRRADEASAMRAGQEQRYVRARARAAMLDESDARRDAVDAQAQARRRARALYEASRQLQSTSGPQREPVRRRQISLARRLDDSNAAIVNARARSLAGQQARQLADPQRPIPAALRHRAAGFLDQQADRRPGGRATGASRTLPRTPGSYRALAALVGAGPQEYASASAPEQLRMRAAIDRELRRRHDPLSSNGEARASRPVAGTDRSKQPASADGGLHARRSLRAHPDRRDPPSP